MPQKRKTTVKSDENVTQGEDSQLSGVFQSDFPIHCKSNGLPVIGVKVAEGATETHTELPYWVSIKNEASDDPAIKKMEQLTIRGWKITSPVITSLQLSLKSHHVTTISLWETGLNSALLKNLVDLLPQIQCRHFELGGSPVFDLTPVSELVSSCTRLSLIEVVQLCGSQTDDFINITAVLLGLRLRCCEITDDLLPPLCCALKKNPPLQQLDLSCNKIRDEGARAVSKVLRVNNNLMVLTLANNVVGDVGAACLMQALREFQLDHEEIVQRRLLFSQCLQQQWESLRKSSAASRRSSSLDHRSNSRDKLSESKKSSAGAVVKAPSFISKVKKGVEAKKVATPKGKGKNARDEGAVTPRDIPSRTTGCTSSTFQTVTGPLADGVQEDDEGNVISCGNLSLISLSLSNNRISSTSLPLVLKTLEYQQSYMKDKELERSPGLMALFLSGNLFSPEETMYVTVCDMVRSRDPLVTATEQTEQQDNAIATDS